MPMIGIVDYGMGNIRSIENVLSFLKVPHKIIAAPQGSDDLTHLIIPGVGAYAKAMENLRATELESFVKEFASTKKPVLGICLGMQLLSSTGNEPVPCEGLNLIDGEVIKLPSEGVRLPHVGWNGLMLKQEGHPLFKAIKPGTDFYFVHSYHFVPADKDTIAAITTHGEKSFVSIVAKENIIGCQFHPEKSQKQGLKLLKNFIKMGEEEC